MHNSSTIHYSDNILAPFRHYLGTTQAGNQKIKFLL